MALGRKAAWGKRWGWGLAIVLIGVAVAVGWRWRSQADVPHYKFATIERGPIVAAVSASGTLNPVTSVLVGSQISGQLQDVFVDFNAEVKAGQLIARIDPKTYQARVQQAQADLDAAQASMAVQQAQINQVEVNLADAKRTLERNEDLMRKNFISEAELDKSRVSVNALTAQLRSTQAQAANALAIVRQREAALRQTRIDLERTDIRSPVNGVVVKRAVDAGQTVAASLQSPELFTIARDLRDMQVDVAIDEADVGRIRPGQAATFTVDAFVGRTFSGQVKQVRKAAATVQNVVTYTVVVSADNPDLALLPGMTANVRIVTDAREATLKVASAALRYRPPGEAGATTASSTGTSAAAPAGGGPGGALSQWRERLVKELALDASQQTKLDAVMADARPKFMALRELPEDERKRASERIRADLNGQIERLLTEAQKPRFAQWVAENTARRSGGGTGRLWVLDDKGALQAITVRTGLTDGASTEVMGEALKEGLQVVIGGASSAAGAPPKSATQAPPRMMF